MTGGGKGRKGTLAWLELISAGSLAWILYGYLRIFVSVDGSVADAMEVAAAVPLGAVAAAVSIQAAMLVLPGLWVATMSAAVRGAAREIWVPAWVVSLGVALRYAPLAWVLAAALLFPAFRWVRARPDSFRWLLGESPRWTAVAGVAAFVALSVTWPVKPFSAVLMDDGDTIVGRVLGARHGMVLVQTAAGSLVYAPTEQILTFMPCGSALDWRTATLSDWRRGRTTRLDCPPSNFSR